MKKLFALAALTAGLGAIGCASTGTSTDRNKWTADPDKAPPVQKNTRPAAGDTTEIPPVKLPPSQTRISSDEIDDTNYKDNARKLESELKFDGRAVSQATK